MTARGRSGSAKPRAEISVWEWLTAALGLVLVLGAVALMLVDGVANGSRPPDVAVRALRTQRAANGWLVEIEAANRGTETAAELEISGELSRGGRVLESASATLDYLPGGARRRAGLYFKEDPRTGELELRPVGFREP